MIQTCVNPIPGSEKPQLLSNVNAKTDEKISYVKPINPQSDI